MDTVYGYEYTTGTHLIVTDEDAADFLQSQFTNELRPFEAGRCTYGLWLDVKGKVLADSYALCEGEEAFRLISETSEAAVLTEKLEKHIIADDVEIETAEAVTGFALIGEGLESVLAALGLEIPAAGQFIAKGDLRVFLGRRSDQLNCEVVCLNSAAADAVRDACTVQSVEWADADSITLQRISAGFPQVPVEIGPNDMPGEGGLESDAVSFTKGCYLGQEVVARMHNVGRPQRALFVVSGSDTCPESPIAIYNRETKQVGELRTTVEAKEGWLGVALLKHRFASVGDVLLAGDTELTVERVFRDQEGI